MVGEEGVAVECIENPAVEEILLVGRKKLTSISESQSYPMNLL